MSINSSKIFFCFKNIKFITLSIKFNSTRQPQLSKQMLVLNSFVRSLRKKNCFLIKIPCLRSSIYELYDLFSIYSKTMLVSTADYLAPCHSCFSINIDNFTTTIRDENNEDLYNFELIYDFMTSRTNRCSFATIFIGFKNFKFKLLLSSLTKFKLIYILFSRI